MDPIHETHVGERGLVDVAAADDATALAFQKLLADRWATATAEQTTRDAGQPGVRLRCYLDLRQELTAVVTCSACIHLDDCTRSDCADPAHD
ncbi:DUF6207 family protein [Streptomyces sp. NPDC102259]|uniref:DUF6207 family protein n=1 Tax=Streptomyces sp. NPDC102259 TaxID=3366148 RepID=UPI00382B05E6